MAETTQGYGQHTRDVCTLVAQDSFGEAVAEIIPNHDEQRYDVTCLVCHQAASFKRVVICMEWIENHHG